MVTLHSIFNRMFAWVPLFFLFAGFSIAEQNGVSTSQPRTYIVLPASEEESADVQWSERLRIQMDNRSGKSGLVATKDSGSSLFRIVTDVNSKLPHAYSVQYTSNGVILSAKDEDTMLWLIYQWISLLSETDSRISANDLPPAVLKANQNTAQDFSFEYRALYSPTNNDSEMRGIMGTSHVDDWGLWGHNLRKIFNGTLPEEVWAQTGGSAHSEQFCFSSEKLYRQLETFILEQYGTGEKGAGIRFCIMPEDNAIVCQCKACLQKGNTPKSATPAVTALLERLARRFPAHLFFTSSYLTTETPPTQKMSANTGVIISAINLPLRPQCHLTSAATPFRQNVVRWKAVTDRLYVWDYIKNFDDYLTPFPVLSILQERLSFFLDLGISGIFYNGSGYDFSSFEDMQTPVIAALLTDCSINPIPLIEGYFKRAYPVSGNLLSRFYTGLEKRVRERNQELPFYGGIGDAVAAYLDVSEFLTFRDSLSRLSKRSDGTERTRLNRLLTALNFTVLELMRLPRLHLYDTTLVDDAVTNLKGYRSFSDMTHYREAEGTLASYLDTWETLPVVVSSSTFSSRLPFQVISRDDAGDSSLLQDGYYGFPTDYHTGWYIFSKSPLTIKANARKDGEMTIQAGFLSAPRWRIILPEDISVRRNGIPVNVSETVNILGSEPFSKQVVRIKIEVSSGDLIEYLIEPNPTVRMTAACDEIEIYEKE